jgi:putative spermidine/putrescine transport system substrate-binding protein
MPQTITAMRLITFALFLLLLCGCTKKSDPKKLTDEELKTASWERVVEAARGSEVYWMHWRGDPAINAFTDTYVASEMMTRYGVKVVTVSGQGAEVVSRLLVDKQAGETANGKIDLVWINGETFHQLRKSNLLFGSFASRLPNYPLVDSENPIINYDFEQPIEGYECPWGSVQLSLIYNSEKIKNPPQTFEELRAWIKANPNRFTYDQSFTGVTFMKSLLYALGGGVQVFQGTFDTTRYREKTQLLWAYLNDVKPFLWRRGEVYPENVAKLHLLFSNGEIDFTMSNNDAEVDNKILQGVLPKSARGLAIRDGTIANSHYQGIPFNAANKAGAMVLCNFLISPEAQYEKSKPDVWADGTVLNISALPKAWQEKFATIPNRVAALPRDSIRQYAKPEVRPEYHERILDDWRKEVLKKSP